jgi:hypothetical protein
MMADQASYAPSAPDPAQAREVLAANVERWSAYHSQKENITWAAATLYVAAIAVMLGLGPVPFWSAAEPRKFWPFFVALFLTAAIGIYFISRQFYRRHVSHLLVHACSNLLAKWLVRPPAATDLEPRDLGKHGLGRETDFQLVPSAVISELQDLKRLVQERDSGMPWWRRLHDEVLTYCLLALWTVVGLAKVFLGWQTSRVWLRASGLLP